MENKHTPGPWTFDNAAGPQAGVIEAPSRTLSICGIHGAGPSDQANARLIAAAPELLDVLQHLLVWDDGNMPGDLMDEARAAIAKATQG